MFKDCANGPCGDGATCQSRSQSLQSSLRGMVRLWENAGENQPLIGCLMISLTHSLLIEICAILIFQEAKYKLVYLTRIFIASLTLRLHSTEQYIHKHNTNYTIQKVYTEKNYTCNANYMQAWDHIFLTNTLTGSLSI